MVRMRTQARRCGSKGRIPQCEWAGHGCGGGRGQPQGCGRADGLSWGPGPAQVSVLAESLRKQRTIVAMTLAGLVQRVAEETAQEAVSAE